MSDYMDILHQHTRAAEARYLAGGRTLLDDPRAIRDAIAEIERLRAFAASVRDDHRDGGDGTCTTCSGGNYGGRVGFPCRWFKAATDAAGGAR